MSYNYTVNLIFVADPYLVFTNLNQDVNPLIIFLLQIEWSNKIFHANFKLEEEL
jgi:hypothetical protein